MNKGSNDNRGINKNVDDCYGWMKCGKKIIYKGLQVWEIPKHTILYKGISDKNIESHKYLVDPFYLPGVPNFIYLTDNLENALIYTKYDNAKIITVRTLYKIRLLDMNDNQTILKIYNKCNTECQKLLKETYLFDPAVPKSFGRNSTYDSDYALANLLSKIFPMINGTAYSGDHNFLDEVLIFNPNIVLERFGIEYRPTGLQIEPINNYYMNYPVEIWLEIKDGKFIKPVVLRSLNRILVKRQKYKPSKVFGAKDKDLFIKDLDPITFIDIIKDTPTFREHVEIFEDKLLNKMMKNYIYLTNN